MKPTCINCSNKKPASEATARPYYCKLHCLLVGVHNSCTDYKPLKGAYTVISKHYTADGTKLDKHQELSINDPFVDDYQPVVIAPHGRKHSKPSRGIIRLAKRAGK